MLPALSVYGALAAERLDVWLRGKTEGWARVGARFWQPVAMVLCVANCLAMMYWTPLVLKEGMVNARTRVSLEESIALELEQMPADVPVMMALSAHVGAVQAAGRTLRSMVSENDSQSFEVALNDENGRERVAQGSCRHERRPARGASAPDVCAQRYGARNSVSICNGDVGGRSRRGRSTRRSRAGRLDWRDAP